MEPTHLFSTNMLETNTDQLPDNSTSKGETKTIYESGTEG